MPSNEIIAFWLMPARAERDFFAALIRKLATRFDAPTFEPHVTLFGGAVEKERALHVLELCCAHPRIELEVDGIRFSDQYTKTLYVQFRASTEALALSDLIKGAAKIASDYQFNPHLSLLYKEMPREQKAKLASETALPFSRVTFDSLRVISTPVPIKRREEVEAWRTLGNRRLR